MQVRLLGVFRNLVGLVLSKSHQIEPIFFLVRFNFWFVWFQKKFTKVFEFD